MKTLEELIKSNPPRLAIMFRTDETGNEQFQWGIAGKIQLATMIGHVSGLINTLLCGPMPLACKEMATVIAFDPDSTSVYYYKHPDIPVMPLVGMLEMIKLALCGSVSGHRTVAQKTQLLGPDGQPMRY